MDNVKKLSNYLSLAKTEDDYKSRIDELIRNISTSFDYSVTVLDSKTKILKHFQSTPEEMFKDSLEIDHSNLVQKNAIRNRGSETFISELIEFVRQDSFTFNLYSDFLDICNVMSDFGYHDYMNSSIAIDSNKTLVFSTTENDVSSWKMKQHLKKENEKINILGAAIAKTIILPDAKFKVRGKLTRRQIEVLQALSVGSGSNGNTADLLHISVSALNDHISKIKNRTGLERPTVIIAEALREGVIK